MFFFRGHALSPNSDSTSRPGLKYSASQFDGTNVARTEPNATSGFGPSMLDLGIALGLGFALGYGTREVVSYRRRQAARERYRQLGLVD
jgi:hypothetical protein